MASELVRGTCVSRPRGCGFLGRAICHVSPRGATFPVPVPVWQCSLLKTGASVPHHVWPLGFLGNFQTGQIMIVSGDGVWGSPAPYFSSGERTVGPGRVKRLQSSQFLLRFSHFSQINLFKLLQTGGLASRVLKNLILTIFRRLWPDLISAFALPETFILLLSRMQHSLLVFQSPSLIPLTLQSRCLCGHLPRQDPGLYPKSLSLPGILLSAFG